MTEKNPSKTTISSRIFGLLFENWQAKLGSVIISFLLFIYLQNSKILVKTVDVPIEYPKLPANLFFVKPPDKTYRIKVEGFRDVVNYHTQFMKVVIDPTELTLGEHSVEVKKIWGSSTSKIQVTPLGGRINFIIEQTNYKTIPTDVLFEEEINSNYIRTSYFIKPNKVTLVGPKTTLDKLNKYTLGTISLKDIRETFTKTYKPVDLPKGVNLLSDIKEFQVKVNIIKGVTSDSGEQIVKGIPINCESIDENLLADLSIDEISIKYNTPTPISSYQIFKGIKATVPCNYTYDSKTGKILPNNLPAQVKIRVVKSQELKSIEILSVIPDRLIIQYDVKKEFIPNTKKFDSLFPEDLSFPEPPEEPKTK
ncbi:MAG: CdaR family protein [Leptospiraceae bacterium]|nr:CdaR family protein [Leptospiraceae bacterium]